MSLPDKRLAAQDKFSRLIKRSQGWLIAATLLAVLFWYFPPNTFHPFCTYDLSYRLNATIDVGGKQYSSQVVFQNSHSRKWIEELNRPGCPSKYGNALSFRLTDNRVILLDAFICPDAFDQLRRGSFNLPANFTRKTIDVTSYCLGLGRGRVDRLFRNRSFRDDGFVIDNAERPTRWHGFVFGDTLPESGDIVRLVSATATAIDAWPTDDLDTVAPGVLKTYFKYKNWWNSPDAIVPFRRRQFPFTYEADQY